jgi:hypothetical protein
MERLEFLHFDGKITSFDLIRVEFCSSDTKILGDKAQ